jgi:hypothetical protein
MGVTNGGPVLPVMPALALYHAAPIGQTVAGKILGRIRYGNLTIER